MAHDHCGAHHVDTDPVRTMDNVVSITSIFAGLLSLFTANETIDISQKEGYQIIKDTILKIGEQK